MKDRGPFAVKIWNHLPPVYHLSRKKFWSRMSRYTLSLLPAGFISITVLSLPLSLCLFPLFVGTLSSPSIKHSSFFLYRLVPMFHAYSRSPLYLSFSLSVSLPQSPLPVSVSFSFPFPSYPLPDSLSFSLCFSFSLRLLFFFPPFSSVTPSLYNYPN